MLSTGMLNKKGFLVFFVGLMSIGLLKATGILQAYLAPLKISYQYKKRQMCLENAKYLR
jgi:hypothetical protein